MRRHWTLAAVLGIALWLPAVAHGATFTVAEPTDAALRDAVRMANDTEGADTILLPAGTIHLDAEVGGLNVYDDVTIIGAAGGSVIDGSDIGERILDVHDQTATQIEGVTFVGATRGAIGFQDIVGDTSAQSLSTAEGHQLVVIGSTFEDNDAGGRGTGGAIDFTPSVGDASLIVSGSTFAGNSADGESYGRGGAIRQLGGAMTVENSTFTGNVAAGEDFSSGGGAIAVDFGQASLKHVTIAGNRAEDDARGGGIRGPVFQVELRSRALSFVAITFTNSIVAQNTSEVEEGDEGFAHAAALAARADDCDTQVGSGGGNVESAETCGFNDASDKRNADAGLGALAANGGATRTMAIGNTSPAYNAAVAGACVATDQRGIARPQFAACDSGAYELAPVSVQPSPVVAPAAVAAQRSCLSARKFRIRLRVPKGERVRSAAVFVNGKKVDVRRGKRLTATVDLRGLTLSRYRVRIVLKLENGRTITGVRRYWTCTPAIRHTRPPKV